MWTSYVASHVQWRILIIVVSHPQLTLSIHLQAPCRPHLCMQHARHDQFLCCIRSYMISFLLVWTCNLPSYHCDNCDITVDPEKATITLYPILYKQIIWASEIFLWICMHLALESENEVQTLILGQVGLRLCNGADSLVPSWKNQKKNPSGNIAHYSWYSFNFLHVQARVWVCQ